MIGVCKQVAVLMFVLKLPSSSHVESFSSGLVIGKVWELYVGYCFGGHKSTLSVTCCRNIT